MSLFKKLIVSDKGFYGKVFTLATPIALQSMITIGVNMLDTIMVGRLGRTLCRLPLWPILLSASTISSAWESAWGLRCWSPDIGECEAQSR